MLEYNGGDTLAGPDERTPAERMIDLTRVENEAFLQELRALSGQAAPAPAPIVERPRATVRPGAEATIDLTEPTAPVTAAPSDIEALFARADAGIDAVVASYHDGLAR